MAYHHVLQHIREVTTMQTRHIRFGAAYYDEYMPQERLATDVAMMSMINRGAVRFAICKSMRALTWV